MSADEVVVEGNIRTEVHLTLDERTGKWRTSTHYILPPGTPTAPALLKTVNGEAPMGSILAAVEAKPHSVHRLCLVPAARFERSSSTDSSASTTSGAIDSAASESSGASSTSSKASSASEPSSTSSKMSPSKTSSASSALSSPSSSCTQPSISSEEMSSSSNINSSAPESKVEISALATTPQPQAQAQPQPQPQDHRQPQPQPQPPYQRQPQPQPQPQYQLQLQPQPQPQYQRQPQPQPQPQDHRQPQPQPQPPCQRQPQPQPQPQYQLQLQPQPQPQYQGQPQPQPQPQDQGQPQSQAQTQAQPASQPHPQAEPKSDGEEGQAQSSTPTELTIILSVEAEEGELPGINLNEDLIVTKVDPGGLLDGKIELGDLLFRFNGEKVKTREEFASRWNMALHKGVAADMEFVRREGAAEALKASLLPPELEKLVNRKSGHEYLLRQLDPEKGPLGLALETLLNRVVVVALRQGSVGAALFKRWDVILAVEGTRVSDAQVAKHIIRDRGGKFSAVVERGPESKWPEWANTLAAKKASSVTNESVDWDQGPADVRLIAATALAARKAGVVPAKPILKSQSYLAKSSNPPQSISFDPMQTVTTIASDLEHNKPLRKVPRQ